MHGLVDKVKADLLRGQRIGRESVLTGSFPPGFHLDAVEQSPT